MTLQVLEMCQDHVVALGDDVFYHFDFVIGIRLAFLDCDGIFGAGTQAGAQAVTEQIADKTRLPVNNLQGAFRTRARTYAATIAFFLVDCNYVPSHNPSLFRLRTASQASIPYGYILPLSRSEILDSGQEIRKNFTGLNSVILGRKRNR